GGFTVALKLVPLCGHLGQAELRSLKILRRLRHPNLLQTLGAWQPNTTLIVAMELADCSLYDRFFEAMSSGLCGIPEEQLRGFIQEAAIAIDFLNEPRHAFLGSKKASIEHRDIKPENILLV